ncbi:hypothetical protein TorRG33x02_126390 [Trema orientale]|uniref:Uncharacterized protein n=1 Tax=Trema orientale TaxID=63057 RepID=A0A2P5F1D5_TREOI|nr:hypothetical protein TorRG33x02_126390 [Trema orientale]
MCWRSLRHSISNERTSQLISSKELLTAFATIKQSTSKIVLLKPLSKASFILSSSTALSATNGSSKAKKVEDAETMLPFASLANAAPIVPPSLKHASVFILIKPSGGGSQASDKVLSSFSEKYVFLSSVN